jgi:aspartyl aminopeptidase
MSSPEDKARFNAGLLDFLAEAVTPFHACEALATRLEAEGYRRWGDHGSGDWHLEAGQGAYYWIGGSLIALRAGAGPIGDSGLRMVGAHTDSPCLMVKPQPEIAGSAYEQLSVEVYGGALLNPWFDRDLSLAGRVSYGTREGAVATTLVDFRDPVAVIPSLAIHLDREANKGRPMNAQTEMAPLLGLAADGGPALRDRLIAYLHGQGSEAEEVLDFELCFYDTQRPAMVGMAGEFIASARLDNLLSCYTGLQALLQAEVGEWALLVCNDHEEVGSRSATGAQGPMLREFLRRLPGVPPSLAPLMDRSMLISADNAHGLHPNFPDKHDPGHGPLLNAGPVIKMNASQRYATGSDGSALFRLIARELEVPVQSFVTRADMGCGSTIGPISAGELGVTTLDIGVPTFAMHSIRELAGSDDAWMLSRVLARFFARSGPLFQRGNG